MKSWPMRATSWECTFMTDTVRDQPFDTSELPAGLQSRGRRPQREAHSRGHSLDCERHGRVQCYPAVHHRP